MGSFKYFKKPRELSGKVISPRLQKLENDFLQNGGSIKNILIEELFNTANGDFDIQKKHINGLGKYVVTSGVQNNGISGRTNYPAMIIPKNTITIDMFGNAYFRNHEYKMVTHPRVFALIPKNYELNDKTGLYMATLLNYLTHHFSYSDMCSFNKIKDMHIALPYKNNEIDFDYMEKYISIIEYDRAQAVMEYLKVVGLKDYKLTKNDEKILEEFDRLNSDNTTHRGG